MISILISIDFDFFLCFAPHFIAENAKMRKCEKRDDCESSVICGIKFRFEWNFEYDFKHMICICATTKIHMYMLTHN